MKRTAVIILRSDKALLEVCQRLPRGDFGEIRKERCLEVNVNEPENRKADGPSEVNSLVLVRSVAGEGKREDEDGSAQNEPTLYVAGGGGRSSQNRACRQRLTAC